MLQVCNLHFKDFQTLVLADFLGTNLFIDADVEEDQKNEGDNTVDEHVEINQVDFDIKRIESQ